MTERASEFDDINRLSDIGGRRSRARLNTDDLAGHVVAVGASLAASNLEGQEKHRITRELRRDREISRTAALKAMIRE